MASALNVFYKDINIDLKHDGGWYKKFNTHKSNVKRKKNKKGKK